MRLKMNNYKIIMYWDNVEKRYIAEIPELSGAMADGKTRLETIKNAEIIIDEWIETAKLLDREIPVPNFVRQSFITN